ncbi:MOSC and FAD-binding oxidoreductase domain-containing protein [Neorhizobium petrolearium]
MIRTAIWKTPVDGRVMARQLNIDGDEQADLAGHGGEQRAVLVYQLQSYRFWEELLARAPMEPGQFGENLTVDGMPDDEVCIGDQYRIGQALFEVSQPRVTCHKLGVRLGRNDMPSLLVSHRRPGFYMRVIEEGELGVGDRIEKIASGPHAMTVASVNSLLYSPEHPEDQLQKAAKLEALSPGWRQSFEVLLAASGKSQGNPGLRPEPRAAPAWSGFRDFKVIGLYDETADVKTFELAAADRRPLPKPKAGQHVVLRLPAGDQNSLIRSYSLSGDPQSSHYRISVKRESGGLAGTYLHERIGLGDILEVSAPRGAFILEPMSSGPVTFISAGIGITPVLSMLHAVLAERPTGEGIWWIHGARDRLHHAFAEETHRLLGNASKALARTVFSQPTSDDRRGTDYDVAGHIDLQLIRAMGIPKYSQFYLCGPQAFLRDICEGLQEWGVVTDDIHVETFGSALRFGPDVPPHPPVLAEGAGPAVTFLKSNLTVRWDSRYPSILDLAEACSVPVTWSCRAGVCHRCETAVVDGMIDYSPAPIDPPQPGVILICCAKPTADLQLDL